VSLDLQSPTVSPTTLPSPLEHAAEAADDATRTRPVLRITRTRHTLTLQAMLALGFDGAILLAMVALAWALFMPWSRPLDAADGLMALGLVVCGGLWAAFVEQDLRRWRRLRRAARR
jgi:hypothetical protein